MEIKTNKHGVNVCIKAHELSEEEMKKIGFHNINKNYWSLNRGLGHDICFYISINKNDVTDLDISVLDEDFLQPYDYQSILENSPTHKIASLVKEKVENIMEEMQEAGVISGHIRGEYI
ncbi:MAG: hypothetical protein K0R54_695 [Clostridiaceae bacterium]|jgi:hypothetical protein|nr:hypothetical protein [Clostridiaceae bacterium]